MNRRLNIFIELIIVWLVTFITAVFLFSGCDDGDSSSGGSIITGDDADDDTVADDDAADDTDDDEGVEIFTDGDDLVIRNELVSVRYHLKTGRFSILDEEDNVIVENAENLVLSHAFAPKTFWHSSSAESSNWSKAEIVNNALGCGKSITVTRSGIENGPTIETTFVVLEDQSCILTKTKVINTLQKKIKVGSVYSLFANGDAGRLIFGKDLELRTLTNGLLSVGDFTVPILAGTIPSISNWSSVIYNQVTGKSLSTGYLTYEVGQPVVYNAPVPGASEGQAFQATCEYSPAKKLAPGETLSSEWMILDFGQSTPFEALELYANRIKKWLHISTWLERHPEIGVPVGWNSWSGSSSSGGYGSNINETIIVDNMDFADRELRKWGMNYFQIDDGWQDHKGDWGVNASRFPDHGDQNGVEWLLSRAKTMGFKTGVWMQALQADSDSQIYAEHPNWFTGKLAFGMFGPDEEQLDLSNPAAQEHLAELMQRMVDWGVDWIKLDFGYQELLTTRWHDSSLATYEYYRNGLKIVREALGDDVFLLNVAIVGPTYGIIDSCRLTLDTMPSWDGEADDPYSPFAFFDNQGLKPMYRDSVRRFYMQNRIWINHPDLIFFRAHAEPGRIPLTLDESRAFATAVAFQGGVVKLGDRLVDLSPEAVDSIRRIIPPYGEAARPLDLFQREFPEVLSLWVPDFDEPYQTVALINWGYNRDLTSWPHPQMAVEDRAIGFSFDAAGLDSSATYLAFEFWTQQFLGAVTGEFSMDVPADTPRVVTLRQSLGRPQLVGMNRHVLGGVGVIRSLSWNNATQTITGVQEGSVGTDHAPFTHRLTFYVPDGFEASATDVEAPEGYEIENQTFETDGDIATLTFDVTMLDDACADGEACVHPDVTWIVSFE